VSVYILFWVEEFDNFMGVFASAEAAGRYAANWAMLPGVGRSLVWTQLSDGIWGAPGDDEFSDFRIERQEVGI
jgi:hypothetical protein